MICVPGQVYAARDLYWRGWTTGDGTSTEGYDCSAYFDDQGRYLGPDKHGIEPIFAD